MKYCIHCGKELFDEAIICPGCGCDPGSTSYNMKGVYSPGKNPSAYVQELSGKVKTEAIIWTVIASIQAFFGLIDLLFIDVTTGTILLVICALNFVNAYNDYKYSTEVLVNPSGIMARFEPLTGLIISLIYNLIFGGIIGVAAIIFGFFVRNYVMDNRHIFMTFG